MATSRTTLLWIAAYQAVLFAAIYYATYLYATGTELGRDLVSDWRGWYGSFAPLPRALLKLAGALAAIPITLMWPNLLVGSRYIIDTIKFGAGLTRPKKNGEQVF
ncbi:hypothetical protein Q8F55_004883 [Vanrija albida]|uniref:Uncharacterized protein n=1 Tax=Vanrija albida TaxID=181172 RepID=A0ABR3Q025_9TREE